MGSENRCAFDIVFTRNVPHIPEKIFLNLDYESYKTCLSVSKAWNKLLMTESYQRKAASVFREDAVREVERLLSCKIKGVQRAEWNRRLIRFIIITLLIITMQLLFGNLCQHWLFSKAAPRVQLRMNPDCRVVFIEVLLILAVSGFALFIKSANFYEYQRLWDTYYWNKYETKTYQRKAALVFREGISRRREKVLMEKLQKEILMKEEKLRNYHIATDATIPLILYTFAFLWIAGLSIQ